MEQKAGTGGHSGKVASVTRCVTHTKAQVSDTFCLEHQLGEGSLCVSAPHSIIGTLALLLQGALETQTPGKQK